MLKSIAGILLDIEGTTSSISFVYDVMFPYVREHIDSFLVSHWEDDKVQACLPLLASDVGQDSVEAWLGKQPLDVRTSAATVAAAVISLMDADVKATGLKQLQGQIWQTGFHDGRLVAHLFEDVAPAIKHWHAQGYDVRIYSSGSIQAQRLFFGHTIAGDLLPLLSGHYDTTTGPKQATESYVAIASEFDCEPSRILFVSDVVAELDAAKTAGLQTALSLRAGNQSVAQGHGHREIESFAELLVD